MKDDVELLLACWDYRWLGVRFDVENGIGRYRLLGAKAVGGWASRKAGTWLALWSDGRVLYFQAERQRWTVNKSGYAAIEEKDGLRTFRIQERGAVVFVIHYPSPAGRILNRLDPTYDSLDDELQDFCRYVVRVWSDQGIQKAFVESGAIQRVATLGSYNGRRQRR
jgi:hypothetical protein